MRNQREGRRAISLDAGEVPGDSRRSPNVRACPQTTVISICVSFLRHISVVSSPIWTKVFWKATDRARTFELSIVLVSRDSPRPLSKFNGIIPNRYCRRTLGRARAAHVGHAGGRAAHVEGERATRRGAQRQVARERSGVAPRRRAVGQVGRAAARERHIVRRSLVPSHQPQRRVRHPRRAHLGSLYLADRAVSLVGQRAPSLRVILSACAAQNLACVFLARGNLGGPRHNSVGCAPSAAAERARF